MILKEPAGIPDLSRSAKETSPILTLKLNVQFQLFSQLLVKAINQSPTIPHGTQKFGDYSNKLKAALFHLKKHFFKVHNT